MKKLLTHPLLWTAVVFIVLPFVAGANPFAGKSGFVDIATTMVIFSLFALGFNLLFGHLGELSFGHAMFFTIGAYATALYTKGFDFTVGSLHVHHGAAGNALVALLIAVGLALLLGFLLARLVVPRSSGIYYSMITLAFAQVIFFVTYKFGDFTGGEDGIQGVKRPTLPGFPDGWLGDSLHYYIFAATIVFVFSALVYWLINSPFGSVLHAIRENKERARFLGYDVNKYRINAFVISTLFPAIAGWLWAYYQTSINPDAGSIEYSGNVVMMSLLGGIQTFFGPILGAIIYWELQNNISQGTKFWEAWIGIVFVVFVLIGPRGIMGILDDIRHYGFGTAVARLFNKKARVKADIAEELPPLDEHAGTTVIR